MLHTISYWQNGECMVKLKIAFLVSECVSHLLKNILEETIIEYEMDWI